MKDSTHLKVSLKTFLGNSERKDTLTLFLAHKYLDTIKSKICYACNDHVELRNILLIFHALHVFQIVVKTTIILIMTPNTNFS